MKLVYSIFIILFIGLLSRSLLPSNSTSDADFEFDMSDIEIKQQEAENSPNENIPETYTPVMALDYRGEWSSHHITNQLSELTQTSGFATFTARKKSSKVLEDYIEFWFYDGKYVDNKALKIAFTYNHSKDFNPQNATFKNSYIEFYAALYQNFNQIKETICSGKYQISFIDKTTRELVKGGSESDENTEAQIWLESSNCDISIFSRVFATDSIYESDVMDYSILMTLVCISHLYACIHMIRSISRNESLAQGYSLLTLATITSWDIYLCLFHLYEAINLDMGLFHYFITPAFWYFILASIFQTRLLTMVWKTRYYRLFETVTDIRRGFASFYFRLYGFMSIFIVMSYFYATEIWFMYLTSLFFVPQIAHNAIRGQKVKFDALYVFFFGFLRFILPLYARGYSYSIFKLTPDSSFIVYYPSILLFQVTALYLQSKLGSRFFIPAYFLPAKHNYFQKIQLLSLQKEDACSICMDNLGYDSSCLKTPMLKIDENSMIQVMKTPCKHIFHEKCLKDWMDIKLECPYCRTMLPSLES